MIHIVVKILNNIILENLEEIRNMQFFSLIMKIKDIDEIDETKL